MQHELDEAWVYSVTKKVRDQAIKEYSEQLEDSVPNFDVPDMVIKANDKPVVPDEVTV